MVFNKLAQTFQIKFYTAFCTKLHKKTIYIQFCNFDFSNFITILSQQVFEQYTNNFISWAGEQFCPV